MKKNSKFGRLLALLLAAVMVISAVPGSVYAALGDLSTGTTNVVGGQFASDRAPVSLPIKIYDYLNDGMLFDYAEAGMDGKYAGGYAGGVSSPYADGLIGTDYTGANKSAPYSTNAERDTLRGDPFQLYATKWLGWAAKYSTNSYANGSVYNGQQINYTQVGAVDNVSPQYMNLRHSSVSGRGFAYVSNFDKDDQVYYSMKDVRYAVIVYRTNDAYMGADTANGATDSSHMLSWLWTVSSVPYSSSTNHDITIDIGEHSRYSNSGQDVAIPKSTVWTYAVVDMKKGNVGKDEYWNGSYPYVTGIGFGFPLVNEGEEMDISHIFYFEREDEADAFGLQATQFNKNPGIDLSKEYYGGASAPVVDIGLDFTTDQNPNNCGKSAMDSHTVKTEWMTNAKLPVRHLTQSSTGIKYAQVEGYNDAVNTTPDTSKLYDFNGDEGRQIVLRDVRYCVIVYNNGSPISEDKKLTLGLNRDSDNLATSVYLESVSSSQSSWTYVVVDLMTGQNTDENGSANLNYIGIQWPFKDSSQRLNLTHVAFFDNSADATAFGVAAAAFDNAPGAYVSGGRGWNMGNNRAYGLLRGSNGGAFAEGSTTTQQIWTNPSTDQANAYYTENIGHHAHKTTDSANKIYHVSMYSLFPDTYDTSAYDTSGLQFDKYNLLSEIYGPSLATMGMLEASLSPNGTPVYREETVAYMAKLLADTLAIPEVNKREYFVDDMKGFTAFANNYYNYNYVKGTPDADKYGTTSSGEPRDLAQALRDSIAQDPNRDPGYTYLYKCKYALGTYAETLTKADAGKLTGSFKAVEANIDTCYDAAYFILNNLFVGNSYNTAKSDYNYLLLQPATVTTLDGQTVDAYVFDAGFTNGTGVDAEAGVKYDTSAKTITNFVTAGNDLGKTMYVYSGDANYTTFHPFLPVTDGNNATGMTMSPYFQDPGAAGTDGAGQYYANRNFSYVMAANGEFTYREDDELFFEFEGDDDVYLFVNGQLVLDIGAAHSITSVRVNINDYVNAALANIASGKYTERDLALALEDGSAYDFDFFYMERHGYGANMRIVTNMRVTDSDMQTEKTAYQNGTQINYGGIVNSGENIEYGFTISNTGANTLYHLSFEDQNIGLSLTPESGFVKTGSNLYDKDGNALDVTDLVVYVDGYADWQEATADNVDPVLKMDTITVTFSNNDELKTFLENLQASETSNVYGGGLWPYAKVTIRGIYYKMTAAQISEKRFNNTLATAANTQLDGMGSTLRGEANMLVMLPGDLVYYQWDEALLCVTMDDLAADIRAAAATTLDSSLVDIKTITNVQLVTSGGSPLANTTSGNVYYATNGTTSIPKLPNSTYAEQSLNIQYSTPGTYVFYIKVTYNTTSGVTDKISGVIPVLANVTNVKHHNYVLDYGLKVDLTQNNDLTKDDYVSIPGRNTSTDCLGITDVVPTWRYSENKLFFAKDADYVVDSGSGQFALTGSTLTYTPSRFMDSVDLLYVAYNVYESDVNGGNGPTPVNAEGSSSDMHNEVQMVKAVRVLPANVVYYEDDFDTDIYNPDSASQNVFTPIGGSGSLYQQADRDQAYGKDDAYQNNSDMSGNSLTKITIVDSNVCTKFTFKGTGLELISRTNASDSASIMMTIKDASGSLIKSIPVITQFDNGNDGGADEIYQVPVVRVKDLPYGTYTVEIKGIPGYEWNSSNAVLAEGGSLLSGTNVVGSSVTTLTFTAAQTGFYSLRPGAGEKNLTISYSVNGGTVSAASSAAQLIQLNKGDVVTLTLNYTGTAGTYKVLMPKVKDTYLYVDGIRIYDPMGTTVSEDISNGEQYYNAAEQNVTFHEIRDLIVNSSAAAAKFDTTGMTVSTGTATWTENLLGTTIDGAEYVGKTSSVDDYLIVGPNNEVYMDGDLSDSSLVFYVKRNAGTAGSLQIALRMIDQGQFNSTNSVSNEAVVQLGVLSGNTLAFEPFATVNSSTEQYYSIDLSKCPVTSDGKIQVVLKVVSGMVSFSSLKSKDVQLVTLYDSTTPPSYTYVDGFLNKVTTTEAGDISYEEESSINVVDFQLLSAQLRAGATDQEPEEEIVIPTITPAFPTVALEDEIKYNIYFSASDLDSVEEMGLAAFGSKLTEGTIADANHVFSGYVVDGSYYMVSTNGIPAKNMGDTMYFKLYAKLTDGTYVYSSMFRFSAVDYVKSVLNSDAYAVGLKQTCVALMNYGAEAQNHFGYNTDSLMNSFLTDDQQAIIGGYTSDLVSPIVKADASKVGEFAAVSGGFNGIAPTVSLEGAFAVNYYVDPANTVDGAMKFYYWDAAAYNAADVLTAENAVSVTTIEAVSGQYCATVSGIAAKDLDSTVYVAVVYESNGVTYCTGVLAVSVSALCVSQMSVDADMAALAQAIIVYGSYAKAYFVQ